MTDSAPHDATMQVDEQQNAAQAVKHAADPAEAAAEPVPATQANGPAGPDTANAGSQQVAGASESPKPDAVPTRQYLELTGRQPPIPPVAVLQQCYNLC
jgi:hypothetical protein